MNSARALTVYFDGRAWLAVDAVGKASSLAAPDEGWLPDLPEGCRVAALLLPIERLLVRGFSLPLSHPRLIDADILAQELEERADIDAEDWWLAWQAAKMDADTVAGIVFGMPESWRQAIAANEAWRHVRYVLVDAWARLQPHIDGMSADAGSREPLAVIDADAQGVCLGVWRPAIAGLDGAWVGMRRLNRAAAGLEDLAEQCLRSLAAMGWRAEEHRAIGRLEEALLQAMELPQWQGEALESLRDLPDRMQGFVDPGAKPALNFRHGRWAAGAGHEWWAMWKRPLAIAAGVLLVWLGGALYQIHSLSAQVDAYRQRIVEAFHRGLPEEPVMIDPLAQLHRAAGDAEGDRSPGLWLRNLAALHKVYQQIPWEMQELEWREGGMTIAGKAASLERLNQIREALRRESGREAELVDTDLSGEKVSFRMHWR